MTGLTRQLAQWVVNPPWGQVPDAAWSIVSTGFMDTLASLIAGRDEPVVGQVSRWVRAKGDPRQEASVMLGTERASATDAALINGTAGHALDFDDVSLGGHPSTVLVPAALAEGQAVGATGAQVMMAYLVGYEVWAELFRREPDAYHTKGWHPTAVFGTVAAAATSAHLRGLNVDQAQAALAIAASMASGLIANFGTMTKPFHAGRAAANGLDAVRLAEAGLSASPDALEHAGGFLQAISPRGLVDRVSPVADQPVPHILTYGLSIKKYPMCYGTHRVIDAVLDLALAHNLQPDQVQRVHATIGKAQGAMLRNHNPVTGLEAKFSLEFAVASSLVSRRVGLRELTDDYVAQPQVRELMGKVSFDTVEGTCPFEPFFALNDRVDIVLNDGRSLSSGDVRFARGNAQLPLAPEALKDKFMDCAQALPPAQTQQLWAQLARLNQLDNVRDLHL